MQNSVTKRRAVFCTPCILSTSCNVRKNWSYLCFVWALHAVLEFKSQTGRISSHYFENMQFLVQGKHLLCNLWSEKWMFFLDAIDLIPLLFHGRGTYRLTVHLWTPTSWMVCLAKSGLRRRGRDWIQLQYAVLSFTVCALKAREVDGEGLKTLIRYELHTLPIRLTREVSGLDKKLLTVYIEPERFVCLRFTNDRRFLSAEALRADED